MRQKKRPAMLASVRCGGQSDQNQANSMLNKQNLMLVLPIVKAIKWIVRPNLITISKPNGSYFVYDSYSSLKIPMLMIIPKNLKALCFQISF